MKPFQMAFGVLVQFSQTVALTELRHAYSCTVGGGGRLWHVIKKMNIVVACPASVRLTASVLRFTMEKTGRNIDET